MDVARRDTLLDFLTSRDEDGDRLGTPALLGQWLAEHGLAGDESGAVSDEDVRQARRLRAALIGLVAARSGGPAMDERTLPFLDSVTREAPLVVASDPAGTLGVAPHEPSVAGALAMLVHLTYEAQLLGEFERFKACNACGWCYYDSTRNRSRRWCDMARCGSREKVRAYRARKKAAGA
jgi:predicted RNA-binding Zn ribbon-like protein